MEQGDESFCVLGVGQGEGSTRNTWIILVGESGRAIALQLLAVGLQARASRFLDCSSGLDLESPYGLRRDSLCDFEADAPHRIAGIDLGNWLELELAERISVNEGIDSERALVRSH